MRNDSPDFAGLLLESSPGCNWVVDQALNFQAAWGDCVPLFGASAAALRGCSILDSVTAAQRTIWGNRLTRVFAGETLFNRETSGTGIYFMTQFPVRGAGGEVRFAGGSAKDVTPWSTAEQELRHTVLGVLRSHEYERGRLSKFLHDGVGQYLSAAGLKLDLVRMDLESISAEACQGVAEVQQVLEQVMEQVRDFSYELNPAMVERTGLHAALDRMASSARRRFPGIVRLNASPAVKIEPRAAKAFFHIAEEAVQNALLHAACNSVDITVRAGRGGATLEVRDNGKGFDPGDVACRRGLGLLSMEHYAAEAGLDLAISSTQGNGTVIRAWSAPTRHE